MIMVSLAYIKAENRKADGALRPDCEGMVLALPDKSKLFLMVFTNWYGNDSICQISSYQLPGAVIIFFSDKVTISGIADVQLESLPDNIFNNSH